MAEQKRTPAGWAGVFFSSKIDQLAVQFGEDVANDRTEDQ
jgi:hypothetical protein